MLEDFISKNNVDAELITFEQECKTAEESCRRVGCSRKEIVKSILLAAKGDEFLLVILPGDRRVDLQKVKELMGEKFSLASASQTFDVTGYEVGALPPISVYGVKTFLDRSCEGLKTVYAGGGAKNALLKIAMPELIRALKETNSDFSIEAVSE